TPLIYCHGFPTNRIEYEVVNQEVENAGLSARVVVLDRPGYGSSSFQPGRKLLDWPNDVAEAADQLGIEEFAVLGTSGGGPYALACAAAMPDRVTRLGLVVAVGPADAPGMDRSLIGTSISRFGLVRRIQFGLTAMGLNKGRDDQILDQTIASLGEVDRPFLTDAARKDWFLRMMREALKQGGRPAAYDAGIYLDSWGLDVSAVTTETHLWYGGGDETVPAQVGEWLAGQLPNSNLVVWPEHGHFTWMASAQAAEAVAKTSGVAAGPRV
ncbi:MAG: alpha/beta hydrolase, partial [Acidimicrobiia bacterium]|nr:alpha/beta hydrolase [Acidimicrobiia bacterium]